MTSQASAVFVGVDPFLSHAVAGSHDGHTTIAVVVQHAPGVRRNWCYEDIRCRAEENGVTTSYMEVAARGSDLRTVWFTDPEEDVIASELVVEAWRRGIRVETSFKKLKDTNCFFTLCFPGLWAGIGESTRFDHLLLEDIDIEFRCHYRGVEVWNLFAPPSRYSW